MTPHLYPLTVFLEIQGTMRGVWRDAKFMAVRRNELGFTIN
jgi:hypothetical protein